MGFDREKRLACDSPEHAFENEFVGLRPEAHQAATPGKRTLVERELTGGPVVGAQPTVGMETSPWSSNPGSAFADFQSRGLHETLAALAAVRGARGLMDATRSAATRVTRPTLPALTMHPPPPDPMGQAMWRAAERRAATLYRRAANSGEVDDRGPEIEAALRRCGDGQPLPALVQREMEAELGVPLDRVRIHTDLVAADAARAVRAEAFTVGEDIFFAEGAFALASSEGKRLLAHELTHVVQAWQGRTAISGGRVSQPGDPLEREADAVAERLGRSKRAMRSSPLQQDMPETHAERASAIAPPSVTRPAVAPLSVVPLPSPPRGAQPLLRSPASAPGPLSWVAEVTKWAREAVQRGDDLAELERKLLHSHWQSREQQLLYARLFIVEGCRVWTGEEPDLDALDRMVLHYQRVIEERARVENRQGKPVWWDTLAETTASLNGKTKSCPSSDEATKGMRSLLTLPASREVDAISDWVVDIQFDELLSRLPGSREALASLVANTKNPNRKLKLWGIYHKAYAMHDAMNDHAGKDAGSQQRHAARVRAATATAAEVDDEIAFMEKHAKSSGKPVSRADVNELIARKDTEYAMEMKYNVNFTNDTKLRKDGSHVHWKKNELDAINNTMRRMPEEHLAGNAGLTEIHRQEIVYWGDPKDNIKIGGIATGTQVLIPDNAVDTRPSNEARQLAPADMSATVSWMEWLITHELGHNVSNKYSAEYTKYRAANGWESYPATTDKLTEVEKATLDAKRGNDFANRAQVTKGGKTYEIDQEVKDGYTSYTQGALPSDKDSVPGGIGGNDPWAYARTRDFEQFAEHYDRAMHVPEKVYQDLIQQPHLATEARRKEYETAASAAEKATAKEKLDIAEATEKARKASFEIMRNQVFGTAKAQQAAEARLKARGVDTTEFNKQAAHASTPDQIAVIEARFK